MPTFGKLSSRRNFDNGNIIEPGVLAVASATTIAPSGLVTRLTGTTAVGTITPPDPYFNGPLYLISTDVSPFTTVTTGNIALATTVVQYKLLILMYDPSVSKWYPNY